MKTLDISKSEGRVLGIEAIHSWVDKSLRYVTNGQYTLTLTRKLKKRSIAQNKLMWLWFACMEKETGQPSIDFHDYYCMKFLSRDFTNPNTGEVQRIGGHTSSLTQAAFADFLNKVQSDAALEFGIALPSPDDEMWAEFLQEYQQFIS